MYISAIFPITSLNFVILINISDLIFYYSTMGLILYVMMTFIYIEV
jgi:hypothetical protein